MISAVGSYPTFFPIFHPLEHAGFKTVSLIDIGTAAWLVLESLTSFLVDGFC